MSGDGGTRIDWMTAAQRLASIKQVLDNRENSNPDQVIVDIEALLDGWQ